MMLSHRSSAEKAGGGSIPSLATMFSASYKPQSQHFIPIHSRTMAGGGLPHLKWRVRGHVYIHFVTVRNGVAHGNDTGETRTEGAIGSLCRTAWTGCGDGSG